MDDLQYGPDTADLLKIYDNYSRRNNGILKITDIKIHSLPPLPENLIELNCAENQLTSLPPLPENLITLNCYINELTSLPPLPKSLITLNCYVNQLTSLPPLPAGLEEFHCGENQLTSLPQLPDDVREFSCYRSPNLTTITGLCPRGIMKVYAKEAFEDCPSLKIQPNDDETCYNFFQRFYHYQTAPKVKIPKGQTDAITMNEIQDGEIMVDFQGEKERNRYYTAQTFKKLRNKNPFTRENIVGHVYYIAELDPSLPVQEAGRRGRKTFRKNRKNKGTRKYRPKWI